MRLPHTPFLNRLLFKLFPNTFLHLFPPQIDPYEDSIEVPEGVIEFEKPIHKRMWRKRFPELVEQWPKMSPKYKGKLPDDPLPGEFEGPVWRISRFISQIRFSINCYIRDWKRNRRTLSLS